MKAFMSLDGPTGVTTKIVSTDAEQDLSSVITAGRSVQGALITNEAQDIRFAFTTTPDISGTGHILAANQSIMLRSGQAVDKFQFCSKATGVHGTVHITIYYEA